MLLARLLTPAQFGIFAMVAVVNRFLEVFRDMGFGTAVIQRENVSEEELSGLFWLNALVSVVLSGSVALAAPLIAGFYDEPEVSAVSVGVALAFFLAGLSVQHQALLRRQMRFAALTGVQLLAFFVGTCCAVLMAYTDWGVWALVGRALTNATMLTVGFFAVTRWVPGRPVPLKRLGSLVRFGLNLTAFNLLNFLSRNADNLIVGKLFGPLALGAYDRAYELMNVAMRQIVAPSSSVAVPALSRLVAEPERYRTAYCRTVDKVLLITTPIAALMLGAPHLVVRVALGDQWESAIPLLAALGGLSLLQPMSRTSGWLFTTQDRTGEMVRWGIVSSVISLTSFLLGAIWGVAGVAWGYAAGQLLRTPVVFWYVGRTGPVTQRTLYETLFTSLSGGLPAAVVVYLTAGAIEDWPSLVAVGCCGLLSLLTAWTALAVSPRGRKVLLDLPRVWHTLRKR